jgi:phosphoglycolate phosphatase
MRPEVFPAIPEILSEIQGQNKLLGVASGNLESVGWTKIKAAGLRSFFSMGSFADAYESRTAVFDAAATAARKSLGSDARICFQAAKAVNARVVAVCTGIFCKEELTAFNPDLCCSSCEELLGKLQ